MAQIAEINDALRDREEGAEAIRASLLDMQGTTVSSGGDEDGSSLRGDAFLVRLSSDGPPEFPYVHAHFRTNPGDPGSLRVELHTDALRKLSKVLHLQHVWG